MPFEEIGISPPITCQGMPAILQAKGDCFQLFVLLLLPHDFIDLYSLSIDRSMGASPCYLLILSIETYSDDQISSPIPIMQGGCNSLIPILLHFPEFGFLLPPTPPPVAIHLTNIARVLLVVLGLRRCATCTRWCFVS